MEQNNTKGNNFNELQKRQKQFLPLFLELKNISRACRSFGLDRKTFYVWMKQPAFAEAVDRLQTEQVAEAVAQIKMHTTSAAEKMIALIDSSDEAIALRASCALLDFYQKAVDNVELEKRLSAVEDRQGLVKKA